MHVTSKAVAVGDIEIACTVVGEGIPLVVLHGAAGLGSTYMRALLDRRTSGRSLCGPTPADDVDAGAPQLGPTARPGTDAKVRSGHGRAENPC